MPEATHRRVKMKKHVLPLRMVPESSRTHSQSSLSSLALEGNESHIPSHKAQMLLEEVLYSIAFHIAHPLVTETLVVEWLMLL